MTSSARLLSGLGLGAIVVTALLETGLGIVGPRRAPQAADLQAVAGALRSEFSSRDLIAVAPSWIDPLVRSELGDLMPIPMLGRPDGRRYARIYEVGWRGARHEDSVGLTPDFERQFGGFSLRRYNQPVTEVSYDFVEHFLDASVLQYPLAHGGVTGSAAANYAPPVSTAPCLFQGPAPSACPPRGPAGAFVCPLGRVERRTLEIAYRPRFGLSVSLGEGQVTEVTWSNIPAAAWTPATLHLWLGLHDYHARKNASGPAHVVVDLDGGQVQRTFAVAPPQSERQLIHAEIALPTPTPDAKPEAPHRLSLRVSAASAAHHHLGVIAELRR